MITLSGPSRPPRSGGKAKQLVVLMHGVGADGADLIELASVFGQALPDAAFISPDAPYPCDMAPYGRQWFSLQDRTPAVLLAAVRLTAQIVDGFLDDRLASLGLGDDRLAIVGFSQGTMTGLHVGLRRERAPAGIVGFSGRLLGPELLAEEASKQPPPVLLIHGEQDSVVPFAALADAERGLRAAGIAVETHACPGLDHGIDPAGMRLAATFLRRVLPE